MQTNVGGVDRAIRIILGIVLIIAGIFAAKTTLWTVILIAVGLVLFATGFMRLCLLYLPFKIKTGASKEK